MALVIQFIACALLAGYFLQLYWVCAMLAIVISLVYYVYMANAKFGGITGDLAGWFLCRTEVLVAVFVALFTVLR